MQMLSISKSTSLQDIANVVGNRNVQSVLVANRLPRTPRIGEAYADMCSQIVKSSADVTVQRKCTLLDGLVSDSDIFETAAISGESNWKLLNALGSMSNAIKIPESVPVPDSAAMLGNHTPVSTEVYNKTMKSLKTAPHFVDPGIFVSSSRGASIKPAASLSGPPSLDLFQYFHIPWGKVTLYSSIDGESVDFPVYPEELSDAVKANYSTMPDMLYQYEPWQLYESSGPRSNSYTFNFHRDMWTGDHRDGKANELIRFCEANCYPDYQGSAVNTSLVTLYISGSNLITGILTDVSVKWDGPIGLDDWYLHCELELSITEVSNTPLNYRSVRNKSLIG